MSEVLHRYDWISSSENEIIATAVKKNNNSQSHVEFRRCKIGNEVLTELFDVAPYRRTAVPTTSRNVEHRRSVHQNVINLVGRILLSSASEVRDHDWMEV